MTEKCRDIDAAVKTVKSFALLPVIVKLPVNVTSFDMVQSCIRSNVPLVSCVLLLVFPWVGAEEGDATTGHVHSTAFIKLEVS